MKPSTQDRTEGKVHEVKGKIKEEVGKVTNDPNLEVDGNAKKHRQLPAGPQCELPAARNASSRPAQQRELPDGPQRELPDCPQGEHRMAGNASTGWPAMRRSEGPECGRSRTARNFLHDA